MLSRLSSSPTNRLAALTLATAAIASGGVVVARVATNTTDTCNVPSDGLDSHARTLVTRRVLACHDYEAGRITKQEYRSQTAIIDGEFSRPVDLDGRFAVMWASSVLGYTTQYSEDSWSAAQALGVPNVYPEHGDIAKAWASKAADGSAEWIELGYAQPRAVSAVEIFETFNPGAIDSVVLITTSGRRIELRPPQEEITRIGARKLVVETECTSEPIAAVRINVASQNVPGWNEIDAVGLVGCSSQ